MKKWRIEKGCVYLHCSDEDIDFEKEKETVTRFVEEYYETFFNYIPNIHLTAIYNNGVFNRYTINHNKNIK